MDGKPVDPWRASVLGQKRKRKPHWLIDVRMHAHHAQPHTVAAAGEGPSPSSSSSQPASSAAAKTGGVSGGSGSGVLGQVEAIALRQRRARFREHGERWAAALGQCAVRVWHLQRVLHKQVDAVSNDRFLDVVLQSGACRFSSPCYVAAAFLLLRRGIFRVKATIIFQIHPHLPTNQKLKRHRGLPTSPGKGHSHLLSSCQQRQNQPLPLPLARRQGRPRFAYAAALRRAPVLGVLAGADGGRLQDRHGGGGQGDGALLWSRVGRTVGRGYGAG